MNEDLFFLGIKGIIRNSKGEVLLLKVNTQKFNQENKLEYWDIPGGRIHINDTVENTLRREIEEETGVKNVSNITPFSMVISNIRIPMDDKSFGLILSAYLCNIDEKEEIKISNEHTEYAWFEPAKTSELLKIKYPGEFVRKIAELK